MFLYVAVAAARIRTAAAGTAAGMFSLFAVTPHGQDDCSSDRYNNDSDNDTSHRNASF